MTNVQYTCPECGSRLFAPPGMTKRRCLKHDAEGKNVYFTQTEASPVNDDHFFVDEDGKEHRPKVDKQELELAELRAEYESVAGTKPDLRWKQDRLRQEIEEAREAEEAMPDPADLDSGESEDEDTKESGDEPGDDSVQGQNMDDFVGEDGGEDDVNPDDEPDPESEEVPYIPGLED